MTIEEWQKRLADTFMFNGVVGGHLFEVHEREQGLGNDLVRTFHGQNALIDSFESFFIETLNLVLEQTSNHGWPDYKHYSLTVAYFNTLFRRYRAAGILYYSGYPLDGYSLLRDIKDRALLICGVLHRMTSIPRIMGTHPPQPSTPTGRKKAVRARKDEENRICRLIIGSDSTLPPDAITELKVWDDLFHEEVHGAKFSVFHELDLMSKGIANRVGPTFYRDAFSMYMSRSAELGWLIARLFPYLELGERPFGDEWRHKHIVLDDSFRYMVQGLSNSGKKIGEAFITLVDQKFSFGQDLRYFDPQGAA